MADLIVFNYQGADVAFDPSARMWNLNAMHQAAGGAAHKAPRQWMTRDQTQEFIAALTRKLYPQGYGLAEETTPELPAQGYGLVVTREGRGGGTWAHWQIAAAYAHYLNPEFYIQWNEWAMERVSGQPFDEGRLAAEVADLRERMAALEARTVQPRAQSALPAADPASGLHPQAQAIIAALAAVGGGPLSTAEIRGALTRAGVAYTQTTQVKIRLQRMARRGQLRKLGRGVYILALDD